LEPKQLESLEALFDGRDTLTDDSKRYVFYWSLWPV